MSQKGFDVEFHIRGVVHNVYVGDEIEIKDIKFLVGSGITEEFESFIMSPGWIGSARKTNDPLGLGRMGPPGPSPQYMDSGSVGGLVQAGLVALFVAASLLFVVVKLASS